MQIFFDESGQQGQRLMQPPPYYALASTNISSEVADTIYAEVFEPLGLDELKYSELRRSTAGHEAVLSFLQKVSEHEDNFFAFFVDKQFALLACVVEHWLEPLIEDKVEFYIKRGNYYFAQLLSNGVPAWKGKDFWTPHLFRFEEMMITRTEGAYREFFERLSNDVDESAPGGDDLLKFIVNAGQSLGYGHVAEFRTFRSQPQPLDTILASALASVVYWRSKTDEPLELVHDESPIMQRVQTLWDEIIGTDAPPATIGHIHSRVKFPLNVGQTRFVRSENEKRIQLCDVLAGASVECLSSLTRLAARQDEEYTEKLRTAVHVVFDGMMSDPSSFDSLSEHVYEPDEIDQDGAAYLGSIAKRLRESRRQ